MTVMNIESKDLVKIIEACGKHGVSSFKSGEIEISFNGFVIHDEKDYASTVEPISHNVVVDPKFEEQQRYEVAQDDTENLLVTDPAKYEEQLFKDELEDSETYTDIEEND